MSKGNWRNWDESQCVKCGARIYSKYAKKYKGEFYCLLCFEKIGGLR